MNVDDATTNVDIDQDSRSEVSDSELIEHDVETISTSRVPPDLTPQPPWLDSDCIPSPMPFDTADFAGALVDPEGIESGQAGEPVFATCKNCYFSIVLPCLK
jgi:hypothetical protein